MTPSAGDRSARPTLREVRASGSRGEVPARAIGARQARREQESCPPDPDPNPDPNPDPDPDPDRTEPDRCGHKDQAQPASPLPYVPNRRCRFA
ncbi:hypothetical protein Pen01_20710 [Phytomonospora endophytica]|nr:hypothetical protein Pen01_20710 [Phytomonospora endophytica]